MNEQKTETRYMIIHEQCDCEEKRAAFLDTPQDVATYLWGRDVTHHHVYEGECPYRFASGDIESITALLLRYPYAVVRQRLPLIIGLRGGVDGRAMLICVIGTLEAEHALSISTYMDGEECDAS